MRAWRSLEALSERPAASYVVFAAGLAVFAVVSIAFPLAAGRDFGPYVRAAFELRQQDIVLPQALLSRAPVTGVVADALLELGPWAAEAAMAILYALSVLCWWRVARRATPGAGIVLAALLLAYPSYVLLFHRLASDALYAAGFALAALLTARFVERRSPGRTAAVGCALALLVLIRPVSQILILLAPLVLVGSGPWRPRLRALGVLAVAAVVPLAAWATHNASRADDFTVVRGAGHGLPLYRAFVSDRIVEPANGDGSRALARAVRDDLLPREPYRSYGVDLDGFFSSGSARMHEDLIGLADRTWGWDDDYAHLARVGREAVLAHPGTYARGVARDSWRLLWWPVFLPVAQDVSDAGETRVRAGPDQLPEPTEGQPIPSASVSAFISTPDGRFREVWTSPSEHEILADDPSDAAHLDRMNRHVDAAFGRFSDRQGNASLGEWVDRASRWFPRPVVWLLVGALGVAIRRPRAVATAVVLTAAAVLVIVGTSLAVPAAAEYAAPVVPAFLVLAVTGLLAPRRARA